MSFSTCMQFGFTCKETIDQKEKDTNAKLAQTKINKVNEENELKALQTENSELDKSLIANEHYAFLFSDLPPLHICGIPRTEDVKAKFARYFGLSQTYFPTTDVKKLFVSNTGLTNFRIPKDIMQKLLNKYPVKLYDKVNGLSDNHVMRFIAYLNISMYWDACAFAVKTKSKWVVAFWATEEDLIYYADPISKQIWLPDKNKIEDQPIFTAD